MIEYYKLKPSFHSSYSGECVYYLSHSLSWVKGVKLWRLQTCRHPKRNPKKKQTKKNLYLPCFEIVQICCVGKSFFGLFWWILT